MRTSTLLFALAVAGYLSAQPAFDAGAVFRRFDANKDGKLSRDEYMKLAAVAPRLKDNLDAAKLVFTRLDANDDGFLSLDEFRKIAQLRQPAKPDDTSSFNDKPSAEQLAFFEKKIRPILVDKCYSCHAADAKKIRGGLVVDSRDGLRKGGDTGSAVVPGQPKKSLLLTALRHTDDKLQMPPKEKLADEVIADFEKWIQMGAPDPRDGAKVVKQEIDIEKGRQFWAFQKPRRSASGDIDALLRTVRETRGLHTVGEADKHTLLRRLFFDLVGLPPTPDEIEAFVKNTKPTAIAEVVDRLLASPQFGERWGRHWLDVARYAESSGKQVNLSYPHAWRYRDWVIAAFNNDKPYDQFVREQLAGDLLPAKDEQQKAEQTVATGFLALGPKSHNERNRPQFTLDLIDEQIDATTQAFLGLTVACARCHDHKYDPIPQKDYYALAGVFQNTETLYGTIRLIQNVHPAPLVTLPAEAKQPAGVPNLTAFQRRLLDNQLAELKKQRDNIQLGDRFTTLPGVRLQIQITTLESKLGSFEADGTPKSLAMGVRERDRMSDARLLIRGEQDRPGDVVPRGVPQVLTPKPLDIRQGSGRRELADWLASPDNPLTARVLVNRVWQHLFGRGLVATPDNFGAAGQLPSHPELLDHLAVTFMDNGWSVKKLIRTIVLSRAYQLASKHDARNHDSDPDNVFVWRMSKKRLEAEALRDGIVRVAGKLDLTPQRGSPIAQNGEGLALAAFRARNFADTATCRAVYLPILRDQLPELLALFDFADPNTVVGERAVTTIPGQSLYLMNSPFVLRAAESAAERVVNAAASDEERVRHAYLLFFARPATNREVASAVDFVENYAREAGSSRRTAWAALCQALFASADFLYLN